MALTAVALALGVYGVSLARTPAPARQANPATAPDSRAITVSGTGSARAKPDTAYINLGFTAEEASLQKASTKAAEQMNAVLAKIKALGVSAHDIQTTNYSIYRDQQRKLWVVSNQVSVTVRDIDSSGALLDGAVAAGANTVSGISFGIEHRADLEKQARAKAVEEARARAMELARLAGVKLGDPLTISEGAMAPPIPYAQAGAAAAEDRSTPVQTGEMEVSLSVQLTYAIEKQ
ncbi:MAG: SIMPL domain-containing protein [Chloroflexota bacterium]|nr:SIMPL domain-containing protein [Chloroflexota bacterium]